MQRNFRRAYYFLPFIFFLMIACQGAQPKLNHLFPGTVILAFGDSLTYGTGASPQTSYPHDLEEMTGFTVINAGVPGNETQDGLARIEDALEKNHPSLVILCLGGNDLLRKRPEAQIKENLKKIIQTIQKTGAQVLLVAVPAFNLSLAVPDFYAELGKELNVPVDTKIMAELERVPAYKSDYIHFNQAGYKALAEALLNLLKKLGAT